MSRTPWGPAVLLGLILLILASQASGESVRVSGESLGVTPPSSPLIKHSTLSLAGISQHDETLGAPHAQVKLEYFNDPQCSPCLEWQKKVLPALVQKYVRTGKVKIQWHGFAVVGPASVTGEKFIAAAGLQSHLWDVLDDVMANQGAENSGWLSEPLLEQIYASIEGFDVEAAVTASSSSVILRQIAANKQEGESHGIEGVPAFLYGPSSGPLKSLRFAGLKPANFEEPINRLLHEMSGRAVRR